MFFVFSLFGGLTPPPPPTAQFDKNPKRTPPGWNTHNVLKKPELMFCGGGGVLGGSLPPTQKRGVWGNPGGKEKEGVFLFVFSPRPRWGGLVGPPKVGINEEDRSKKKRMNKKKNNEYQVPPTHTPPPPPVFFLC